MNLNVNNEKILLGKAYRQNGEGVRYLYGEINEFGEGYCNYTVELIEDINIQKTLDQAINEERSYLPYISEYRDEKFIKELIYLTKISELKEELNYYLEASLVDELVSVELIDCLTFDLEVDENELILLIKTLFKVEEVIESIIENNSFMVRENDDNEILELAQKLLMLMEK